MLFILKKRHFLILKKQIMQQLYYYMATGYKSVKETSSVKKCN